MESARSTFKQGLKNCPTNQPLLLSWALKEMEQGEAQAALDIFRLSTASQGALHAPLLEAWLQLAERMGEVEEMALVRAKLEEVGSSEKSSRNNKGNKGKRRKPPQAF